MAGKKGQKIIKEECKRFKEYYQKYFPELSEDECKNLANKFKKSCNYRCIEYYEKNYPKLSHEEHLKLLNEKLYSSKENNKNHIEYYKKRYPELSEKEQYEMLHKYAIQENFQCIEYYKKRYPELSEKEQYKLLKNAKKSYLANRPNNSGENNPNHHSRTDEKTRKERSPFSKEFYEKRGLNENDRQKFLKSVKREYTTQLSYYLNKGYSLEESYIKLKERQTTFSLKKCIEKYGEEIGTIKYTERQHKWLKSLQKNFKEYGDGRAQQSKFAKEIILEICKYFDIKPPKKEYYIYDKEYKRAYAYDFTFNYHIIEFNGDYWHCNPNIFNEDYVNKVKQKTAKEIWEYDKIKQNLAESYKNKYLVIWESEYNDDKEKTIQKCIDFIKE